MVDKRYNQFIQQQMRNEQPDKEKLISLASLLRRTFGLVVHREAILLFDRETDKLKTFASWITEEQYKEFRLHVPDLLMFIKGKLWIIEIDGYVHYVKNSVQKRDIERDRIYEAANLNWFKIEEWVVLIKLGKKADRSATAAEIWPEIEEKIEKIME